MHEYSNIEKHKNLAEHGLGWKPAAHSGTTQLKKDAGALSAASYLIDNRQKSTIQLVKGNNNGKVNTPRFINPARRRPGVKRAQWLEILETKKDLIEGAGFTIDEVMSLKKHLAVNGQEGMLDDYLKLADIKKLSFDQAMEMVSVAKSTVNRGYPYPFETMKQYDLFKLQITKLARVLGINYTEIRVQGSAIRKTNPKDIDLGTMVNKVEFDRLSNILLGRFDRPGMEEAKRGRKQLDKRIEKGMFGPRDLAMIGEEHTGAWVQVIERANAAMMNAVGKKKVKPVQISVILLGGTFDLKPYMRF